MPVIRLDAFAGPLDLLLELARAQRVDLGAVSIVGLADRFIAAIEAADGSAALSQRGDWLVMAAWLVLLKSRLLLPAETAAGRDAQREAAQLRDRLAWRERMGAAVAWLDARPRLGRDIFARPSAGHVAASRGGDVVALLEACLVAMRIGERETVRRSRYAPVVPLWRVGDALARMRDLLGAMPDGSPLAAFLPPPERLGETDDETALRRRANVASALVAGLELTREGRLSLRQEAAFDEIRVHRTTA